MRCCSSSPRSRDKQSLEQRDTQVADRGARSVVGVNLVLHCRELQCIEEVAGINSGKIGPEEDHALPEAAAKTRRDHRNLAHRRFSRDHKVALAWSRPSRAIREVRLIRVARVREIESPTSDVVAAEHYRSGIGPDRCRMRTI